MAPSVSILIDMQLDCPTALDDTQEHHLKGDLVSELSLYIYIFLLLGMLNSLQHIEDCYTSARHWLPRWSHVYRVHYITSSDGLHGLLLLQNLLSAGLRLIRLPTISFMFDPFCTGRCHKVCCRLARPLYVLVDEGLLPRPYDSSVPRPYDSSVLHPERCPLFAQVISPAHGDKVRAMSLKSSATWWLTCTEGKQWIHIFHKFNVGWTAVHSYLTRAMRVWLDRYMQQLQRQVSSPKLRLMSTAELWHGNSSRVCQSIWIPKTRWYSRTMSSSMLIRHGKLSVTE